MYPFDTGMGSKFDEDLFFLNTMTTKTISAKAIKTIMTIPIIVRVLVSWLIWYYVAGVGVGVGVGLGSGSGVGEGLLTFR